MFCLPKTAWPPTFAEPNYYWASQKKIKAILADMGLGK